MEMDWTTDKITNNDRGPKLSDLVDMLDLPSGAEFKQIRMIGPSRRVAKHYLPVFKQDGTPVMKNGQQVRIPKVCLAYDDKTDEYSGKCPYCKIDPDSPKKEVHTNVIDREEQENEPAKKKPRSDKEKKRRPMGNKGEKYFIKDGKSSKAYTPARFMIIKSSVGGKISDFTSLNKKKLKDGTVKTFGPDHPKYGFDMQIKFDKNKSGSEMYSVVKDERTSLSEEELDMLLWDIYTEQPEEYDVAKKEAASFAKRMEAGAKNNKNSDEDDDEDDDERPKKSKNKKSSKSKSEDDSWDDDEDFESDDDDEDDDEPKSKKKIKDKKSSKSKKKSRDEDEDDDDDWEDNDDEDEEEDEDERPKKSSKSSKGSASKNKSKKNEDDDEDDDWESDDDDEDDEDEDERPKKKSKVKDKKPSKSKRSRDDDDDDEDEDDEDSDDEDDEDEDERPKKSKNKKSSSKNKSRKDDDDDDDDWDDD